MNGQLSNNEGTSFAIIKDVGNLIQLTMKGIAVANSHIYEILQSGQKNIEAQKKKPVINIFQLVSDYYYRENFHSDIIAALLNYTDDQNKRPLFNSFISYVREIGKNEGLEIKQYDKSIIHREKGRIDISILENDESNNRAIVIENKINNAPDMDRQIPRYVNYLSKKEYDTEIVVYLVLNNCKAPNTYNWTQEDLRTILPLIVTVKAVDTTESSMSKGWLEKSLKIVPQGSDIYFLLYQYINLLNILSKATMNNQVMEQFLQHVLIDDNYDNALAVKDMLSDLIFYRRNKLLDFFKYKKGAFTRVIDWNNVAVIDNLKLGQSNFAIDIVVDPKCYKFQFFDRNFNGNANNEETKNPASEFLQMMNIIDFDPDGLRMQKIFYFPKQESEIYTYTERFITEVERVKDLYI